MVESERSLELEEGEEKEVAFWWTMEKDNASKKPKGQL